MINNKRIIVILIILGGIAICGWQFFYQENQYNQVSLDKIVETPNEKEIIEQEKIKVHIDGEVNKPGLIEVEVGSRIADAIELANGLTSEADISKTNLAYILSDGEKIYIPNINDEDIIEFSNSNSKININTASISELKNIPGVGESTANSIFDYRNKNGKFINIEDIKNVSGIGESKFDKMKDYITTK